MKKERVIDKIRKLLAMADDAGASATERETAMRQATKLMDKYAVDLDVVSADSSDPRGQDSAVVGSPVWKTQVFSAIGRLYGCVVYVRRAANPKDKAIVIIGRESARLAILSMSAWIITSIEKELASRNMPRGGGGRDSFKKGAAIGVHETVSAIIEEREKGETINEPGKGLMVVEAYKNELMANQEYLQNAGVKLSSGKGMRLSNQGAFSSGRDYGRSINLSKQVTGSGQKRLK